MSNPLNLSPAQRETLELLRREYILQLASFKFNEPKDDDVKIRQHAAVSGKVDVLDDLLDEEQTNANQQQNSFNTLIDNQLGNQ
jgi:hypothetical protein